MFCLGFALFAVVLLLLAPAAVRAADPLLPDATGPRVRVVTVYDPDATEAFHARPEVIKGMVRCGLTNLTGRATPAEAMRSLVSTQDVVGIKVYCRPGPNSGTRPSVVAGIVEALLAAGLPPRNIVIWDKQADDLRLAGFLALGARYGVRVAGSAQSGSDSTNFYDNPIIGDLVWGDYEFEKKGAGVGRKSFVSNLVSHDLTRIINVTPLLNHNTAGVTGNLYSLAAGSVDNFNRFEMDPARMARAVPEIYAMASLSDKVVLNVTDAVLCQYEGSEQSLLHYSTALNELRFSRDPVALDTLSLKDLEKQRQLAGAPSVTPNTDLYNNAVLLELGVNDLKRIENQRIKLAGSPAGWGAVGNDAPSPASVLR
ncbi:MAG TPA: DUF362 domain-containing protein [Verrucomicrobiae bacterium]|nr:DUF362 domain-containing protein [Verrucomicrobiae bacterium]